jgi:hypothetical protein
MKYKQYKFFKVLNPTKLTETKLLNLNRFKIAPALAKTKAILPWKCLKTWNGQILMFLKRKKGFPDIYLEMHIEAIKEFGNFEKEKRYYE